jgi:sRNA-binding protein
MHALLKGGPRYALDGTGSGEITAEEQEQATRDLEAVFARHKARRRAQHPSVVEPRRAAEGAPAIDRAGGPEELRPPES